MHIAKMSFKFYRLPIFRTVVLPFVLCARLSFAASDAKASFKDFKLDHDAWACSGSYSGFPLKVLNGKDRETAICAGERSRRPMARAQAFDRCRQQFSATSLLVNWTSKGWHCRYYGR